MEGRTEGWGVETEKTEGHKGKDFSVPMSRFELPSGGQFPTVSFRLAAWAQFSSVVFFLTHSKEFKAKRLPVRYFTVLFLPSEI
jgi:hypothetical protein